MMAEGCGARLQLARMQSEGVPSTSGSPQDILLAGGGGVDVPDGSGAMSGR